MISPYRIKYNTFDSQDFDLIMDLAFEDGDNGEVSSYLNREAIASESYRGEFKRVHNYKYSEVLAPKFTFMKRDFSDFTFEEHRRILSWLTSKMSASWLTVYYDDTEVVTFELLGGWTEIQPYKISNGRTIGYTATFESVSPYAYSAIKSTGNTVVSEPTIITINCRSDEVESYVYPKITIVESDNKIVKINSDIITNIFNYDNLLDGTIYEHNGTYYWRNNAAVVDFQQSSSNTSGIETTGVMLINRTTGTKSYVKYNLTNETVVVDGANKLVYSSTRDSRVFGKAFKWEWLPLVNGINEIQVIGNCTINIEYREPIKCGEF